MGTANNSAQIKVGDAIDLYFSQSKLPESIRDELKKRLIDMLKNLSAEGGGVSFGNYCLEVFESGSEYYVDAAMFYFVMEQLRLKGSTADAE